MKTQTTFENNKNEQFEIKNPRWTFVVCLLAAIGFVVGAMVTFCWVVFGKIEKEYSYLGVFLILLSLVCFFGVYICIVEKLTYSNRVYTNDHWYGKKEVAKVSEISKVKILTIYWHSKYGIRDKQKVFFYNDKKEILIQFNDDGTVSKNELFLSSLKANRIKIVREEKWEDYSLTVK